MSQNIELLRSKFRGCLLGALVGDCLGSPFEYRQDLSEEQFKTELQNFLSHQLAEKEAPVIIKYTDDTVMTRCIAESLIQNKQFNAKDIARRFVAEYFAEPDRGYGGNIAKVFQELKRTECERPFEAAQEQFGGRGSYGNGGAMRIAPIALFGSKLDLKQLIELCETCTRITHSNSLGINGATLQCLAICQALDFVSAPQNLIDYNAFLDQLIQKMGRIEGDSSARPFTEKLMKAKALLAEEERGVAHPVNRIVEALGNGVSAIESVPTAIYAALRGLGRVNDFESGQPFVRTLYTAVSLGGDTDTIASMACAISGALLGVEAIPRVLVRHSEAYEVLESDADELYRLVNEK